MSWTTISLEPAELTLHTTGKLTWNLALQLALGNPRWVNLMWDETTRRLGLRPMTTQITTGLPIIVDDDKVEYKVSSTSALNAAGIPVDQNLTDTPDSDAGIFYITLPE